MTTPRWAIAPLFALLLTGCLGGGGGGGDAAPSASTDTTASAQPDTGSTGSTGSSTGSTPAPSEPDPAPQTTGDTDTGSHDPLTPTSYLPADGSEGVELLPQISGTFNNPLDPSTVSPINVLVASIHGGVTPKQVYVDDSGKQAFFVLQDELALATTYRAQFNHPGYTPVTDIYGSYLTHRYRWWFTTRDGVWQSARAIDGQSAASVRVWDVGFDEAGNAFVVYSLGDGGAGGQLWAARRGADGSWGTPHRFAPARSTSTGAIADAALAVTPGGQAFVLYDQLDPTTATSAVAAAHYVPGGSWSASRLLGPGSQGGAGPTELAIATDASGNAVAAWSQRGGSGGVSHLWVDTYAAGGQWAAAQDRSTASSAALSPGLALNADGQGLLAWRADRPYAQPYSVAAGWGSITALAAGAAGATAVAVDRHGNGLALWSSGGSLLSREYLDGAWGGDTLVADTGRQIAGLSLATSARGRGAAVYSVADPGGAPDAVYGAAYPGSWRSPVLLDQGAVTAQPRLAVDGVGNALAVWRHGNNDIVFGRYTGDWRAAAAVEQRAEAVGLPAVGVNPLTGKAVAAWAQAVGGLWSAWAGSFE